MTAKREFEVTYWGTTGSLGAPLRPEDVAEKLVQAVQQLLHCGALRELGELPPAERVRHCLERYLPFHLRSTYGGNTTCIQVQTPDALLIFDSGSGFREL